MIDVDVFCIWITELVPLFSALFSLFYGIKKFFKKGKPLFLQTITMAMGSHALSSIYHLCQTLTRNDIVEGFTPAYLGRIGFFLFFITASYGQMDRIVDDGSPQMKPSRHIALIAPICAMLLYIPNCTPDDIPIQTKITYLIVWIPAVISVYFNLKHAIIPNLDFNFIKAIKPYNIFATVLCFAELLCLTAWNYYHSVFMAITSVVFSVLCVCTIVAAKKGADKWTI